MSGRTAQFNNSGLSPKAQRRAIAAVLCVFVAIISGVTSLIAAGFADSSPVNYRVTFKSAQLEGVGGLSITGTINNAKGIYHPYIDFTISYDNSSKTLVFRVDDVGEGTTDINQIIPDFEFRLNDVRIISVYSPVKPASWYVELVAGIIFCIAIFVLIVPNVVRLIIYVRKEQAKIRRDTETRLAQAEKTFCTRRRELFLRASKAGDTEYDFDGAYLEKSKRSQPPATARAIVGGEYLTDFDFVKPSKYRLSINRDDARELARRFDSLEKGQEITVRHAPLQGLYGNAVVEATSRTGTAPIIGFLRMNDVRILCERYGAFFAFYGKIDTLPDRDAPPIAQASIVVPKLTAAVRQEFYAYDPIEGDYDEASDEDNDNENFSGEPLDPAAVLRAYRQTHNREDFD